jgi:hypothetical protein
MTLDELRATVARCRDACTQLAENDRDVRSAGYAERWLTGGEVYDDIHKQLALVDGAWSHLQAALQDIEASVREVEEYEEQRGEAA